MFNVREVYQSIREDIPIFAERQPLEHTSDEFPLEAIAAGGKRGYAKI
jgi:hypothetical protein